MKGIQIRAFVLLIIIIFLCAPVGAHEDITHVRGQLHNSFLKFEKEHKGRVAFVGGSITEMKGWHNIIMEQLQKRFPKTSFDFIEAGISSTGTTPGAFRIQHDVLSRGEVDLLFVEAAVNDATNFFTPQEQVRGMEGEVRSARLSNPNMDIIMLHFICDDFLEIYSKGQVPDVIFNHERVANHYIIPSINLSQDIYQRIKNGEITWQTFGGTHPSWMGHHYYAAAIMKLFDEMWINADLKEPIPHVLPEALDVFSYCNADFIDIKAAKLDKAVTFIKSWRPTRNIETRRGFVDVPMLVASQPKAQLTLNFEGKAIGLFCVSGPSAGIIEYSIDGAPFKQKDTYTPWSKHLYLPWVFMLETELANRAHKLVLRLSKTANVKSEGTEFQIRNFVVNR